LEGISRSKLMKDDFNFAGTKFCLIFPPYRQSADLFFLKATKKDLGKIPPLSLCTVAAVLERYGGRVKIIDVNVSKLSLEDTLNEIIDFGPDFLGFTLSTYQFHFTLEWIKKIRRRINKPVIVGGSCADIFPPDINSPLHRLLRAGRRRKNASAPDLCVNRKETSLARRRSCVSR